VTTLNEHGVSHLGSDTRQHDFLLERVLGGDELCGNPVPAGIDFGPSAFDTTPRTTLARLVTVRIERLDWLGVTMTRRFMARS
jgi:hypothetical protein